MAIVTVVRYFWPSAMTSTVCLVFKHVAARQFGFDYAE